MDEKILELLNEMNNNIVDMKQDITGMKQDIVGIKQDITDLKVGQVETNNRLDSIEKKQDTLYNQSATTAEEITYIKDNFDVVDIKLNAIETRVITINRKLNGATDQVARNMEQLEEIKIKLQ
ncbi:hypothetical protein JY742_10120 [Clostridioides difficile]|nr:hypothetical protein [Clostridioides difficile]